jgi:putative transposase
VFALSERRAAGLVKITRKTLRYRSRRPPQDALRRRLRELAASRVRFGYRRLTVMLRREGWRVNPKRVYRLYTEDGLTVRTKLRKKLARRSRVPMGKATRPHQKLSMDFMSAKLIDGRWFRVLTVIDQFTRECLALVADRALNGHKVALALSRVIAERGTPESITVDNGSEFAGRAMEAWSYQYGVRLEFIRPGRPVDNGYIESFNGRLRDECLNVETFFGLSDVSEKLERWRQDYHQVRPHSALADRSPEEFARQWKHRSAARTRTAWPTNQSSSAVQSVPPAVEEPIPLFVPPSAEVKGGAEKLSTDTGKQTPEHGPLLEVVN